MAKIVYGNITNGIKARARHDGEGQMELGMDDDSGPLVIDARGVFATIAALVDHLASRGVTDRKAFAAHLRTTSLSFDAEVSKQILGMADALDSPGRAPFTVIEGGKSD